MKSILLSISLVLLASFTFQTNTTNFEINSPKENQIFNLGDSIFIKGTVSSDGMLHDLKVRVYKTATDETVFSQSIHTHSNKATLNYFFVNGFKENTDLTLHVYTMGHGNGIQSEHKVNFKTIYKQPKKSKSKTKRKSKNKGKM